MFTISLKGMRTEITPAIRSYTEEKVRMLEKLIAPDEQVFVEAEVGKTTEHHQKGEVFRAEITLKTPYGSFRAESKQEDLYAAIDVAKDELSLQLKEHKDKREANLKKGGRMFKDLLQKIGFGE